MYFPPGSAVAEEEPRRLLDEFWRTHDRTHDAPFGERYVAFESLIARAVALGRDGWDTLLRLYAREHSRRRLPPGTELEWIERARARRG